MLMRFKTLSLSIIFLGLSANSFAQTVLVKTEQNIEEYKLDNGMRVVLAPNDKENKIFINTVYLTGSLNDPQSKGGLAHLLEHLAFKGTQNVKEEEFQRRLDQFTLSTNASTDYFSTKYTNIIRPEKKAIDELMYLEAERMDKLVLQEKFVPTEIDIVKREREIRMDQPSSVLMDQMWKAAFGNQSLGRLPIGDLNELQSIKMNELNQFYRTWYAPNNAVMVVAGKFNKADVLSAIEKNFSQIPARSIPETAKVPVFKPSQMKVRQFSVEKGSDLAKYNVYLGAQDQKVQAALSFMPYLYTMQPSGHLYKQMVETGVSTNVFATTWLDKDFNLVLIGAVYAPNHNAKAVKEGLISGVEKPQKFGLAEIQRIKSLVKNGQESLMVNSSALGSMLSDYIVSWNGDWTKLFKDLKVADNLTVDEVNSTLSNFLVADNRIEADIFPTPEELKKAQTQQKATEPAKTLDQKNEVVEPLKDPSVYKAEVAQYVASSKVKLEETEKKIQRGQFKNGMKYALFPTTTRDDKIYMNINIDFGTAESLFNKGQILDLTSYLLMRASEKYSLQDITDKAIAVNGGASASASGNGMNISIVAKKENFDDFFAFILDVLKNPKFEQSQFDLIKSQSLSSLDRPYTEPGVVAGMALSRVLETHQPGDLRYHFEPDFAKQQLQAASNDQVKKLYQQFFAMDHSNVAVTGEFDAKKMKKTLSSAFQNWNKKQPYEQLITPYIDYKAQKIHALSEPREFGAYISVLPFPMGDKHPDAASMIVFKNILTESQLSSRLAKELREKNALVYSFGSSMNLDQDVQSGAISISANYAAGKSAEVSQAIHKVFKDLLEKGVTEQEVEAAKADIMKNRMTSLEDERRIQRMLNNQLFRDTTLLTRQKRDESIAQVTKADVDAVIKKYIDLSKFVEVMADQYGQPLQGLPVVAQQATQQADVKLKTSEATVQSPATNKASTSQ